MWLLAAPCGAAVPATPAEARPAEADAWLARLKALSLEELVRVRVTEQATVSRVDEKIDETPGSVYVYTRDVIQKRGYRSLGELLQTVPGFTVFHRDLQYVASARGLNANDNEKITLLINGQNLNGVSEPDFLNGPINLDNVERVEVVVGPSSLFQPANTLAATVNVITKKARGVEVTGAVGSDLPYSATLMAGKEWAPDKSVSFSFTSEQKEGFHAWLDKSPRGRPYLGDRTGELGFPSFFSVLSGRHGELSAQAVAYRTTSPELNIDEQTPNNDGRTVDEFYAVSLKDEHPWTADLVSVASLDAAYKSKTRLERSGSPTNALEIAAAQWDYAADLGLRHTGLAGHLIQAGVQGGYVSNFDTYAIVSFLSGKVPKTTLVAADSQSVGFYADDEYRVTERLKLVGGVRADHNTVLRNANWYPGARAAVIVEPTADWVSKLTYNRAVRMPTAIESPLNQAWGKGKAGAPAFASRSPNAVRPEILSTFEWQNIVYAGRWRGSAAVYHQELQDFIGWFGPWTNIGDFRGEGVELTALAQLHPRLQIWANASWNESLLHPSTSSAAGPNALFPVDSQGRIIGSPEYMANAGFDFEVVENLSFSPALRYFTEQAASDGGVLVTIRNRAYVDAALRWRDLKTGETTRMDATLSGYNLADNRDPVAAQWRKQTYAPRGIAAVLALDLRF